jgi:hypothetical protein
VLTELLSTKMHFITIIAAALVAPLCILAAPLTTTTNGVLDKRENLCNLSAPPQLCQPNSSVTVEETARRAYQFYRAFVVDGDPRTMFSLIDSVYKVRPLLVTAPSSVAVSEVYFVLGSSNSNIDKCVLAKLPRLPKRTAGHLAPLLQRQEDGDRAEHGVVLRRQHQHVVCAVLGDGPLALGGWLCS